LLPVLPWKTDLFKPDALLIRLQKTKHIIGIEIHSGRNRIVRRILTNWGTIVRNLDRVM
jgi:23S rRNA pseudouridine2605 synthase